MWSASREDMGWREGSAGCAGIDGLEQEGNLSGVGEIKWLIEESWKLGGQPCWGMAQGSFASGRQSLARGGIPGRVNLAQLATQAQRSSNLWLVCEF